jgi:hypothetical protein
MKPRNQSVNYLIFICLVLVSFSCKKEKTDPVIKWENPEDILYGTLLDSSQLNATANIPGVFAYTPPEGTKLEEGENQDLKVDFTPTDLGKYNTLSKKVKINVTDHIYKSLNDTLIGPVREVPREETEIYNLDFDNDDTIDITVTSYSLNRYHIAKEDYVSISSSSGYEVKTSDIPRTTWTMSMDLSDTIYHYDTVSVPYIFNEKDILSIDEGAWKKSTLIVYAWNPGDLERNYYSKSEVSTWYNIGYKYIGLRNLQENKLVWLKMKVTGYSSTVLSGYKVYRDKNEITI